jgi:DNA-binding protein
VTNVYPRGDALPRQNIIPKAPLARILMEQGAKRVSADAVDKFEQVLNDIADEIAQRSWDIAKHSGRKTIHDDDIKLAARNG